VKASSPGGIAHPREPICSQLAQERNLAVSGDLRREKAIYGEHWRGTFQATEFAKDGHRWSERDKEEPKMSKKAEVFDGKMCNVGLHRQAGAPITPFLTRFVRRKTKPH
jgi:hypothetical protein